MRLPEWRIPLCLLAAAPFLLACWVHGDGIGYVTFLRSAVIEHDLRLADEFQHLSTHIESDGWGLPIALLARSSHRPGIDPTFQRPQLDPVTGRVSADYSIGPAIAWAPAYLVAHALTHLGMIVGIVPEATGYGGLYYLAIALTSLVLGAGGLVFACRLAAQVAPAREAAWSALTLAWASSLTYYLYLAPSYSHALTVFTSGAFFLHWWSTRRSEEARVWFRWGLLSGAVFLVHWNDLVMAAPPLCVSVTRLLRRSRSGEPRRSLLHALGCMAAAALGLLLMAIPQLLMWQYLHGRPWVRHPAGYVGFRPEGLWQTLISARHGLFVWTPVTLLAVAGLLLLLRRDRELAGVSLAALLLLVVTNCAVRDWWGGAAFGMRRLIGATPLFTIGLAVLLDEIRRAWARGGSQARAPGRQRVFAAALVAPLVFAVFSAWNLLLLAQYALGMISHTGSVPLGAIAANQPRVLARLAQIAGGLLR